MKKKEIYILISIILIAVLGIIGLNITKNKKQTPTPSTDSNSLNVPTEQPKGVWVGIVHRGKAIQWFDSGVDGEYVVTGDVGELHVEVKDGKWHVREVECPTQTCKRMGWADENSITPITCFPNNIFIGTANILYEYLGVK